MNDLLKTGALFRFNPSLAKWFSGVVLVDNHRTLHNQSTILLTPKPDGNLAELIKGTGQYKVRQFHLKGQGHEILFY